MAAIAASPDAPMQVVNLLQELPANQAQEVFDELLRRPGLRLERIVSRGHATPAGQWCDQEADEWVLLLVGSAGLRIDGEEEQIVLKPGDSLTLPARVRHRVEWTDATTETIWLALHYHG